VFFNGTFLGVYSPFWIAVALCAAGIFVMSKTRTGKHFYAVGSNMEAARLSGVRIPATIIRAYLISGFCAFVAGMFITATNLYGKIDAGSGYEIYSVAAALLGGISMMGGKGLLAGSAIGACIWCVLDSGLIQTGVPIALRNILVGGIIVATMTFDVGTRYRRRRT
jgi:ribose transport system permease protein